MALNFALPALLFVGMSTLPKGLLDVQLKLALCLIVVHVGLFLLAHLILHKFFHVETSRSLVFSLFLAISAAPIYGIPRPFSVAGDHDRRRSRTCVAGDEPRRAGSHYPV
jgi:predicted permease